MFLNIVFSPCLQLTGEPLMRRSDDTADKLRSRLKAFHQQTQPVIDYYERAGKTVNIDAKQDKNVRTFTLHSIIVHVLVLRIDTSLGSLSRLLGFWFAFFDATPCVPRHVRLHEHRRRRRRCRPRYA